MTDECGSRENANTVKDFRVHTLRGQHPAHLKSEFVSAGSHSCLQIRTASHNGVIAYPFADNSTGTKHRSDSLTFAGLQPASEPNSEQRAQPTTELVAT